jgi:hypothetical protein
MAKEATFTSRKLINTLISIGYHKTKIARVSVYSEVIIWVMFGVVVVQKRVQKLCHLIPERRAPYLPFPKIRHSMGFLRV